MRTRNNSLVVRGHALQNEGAAFTAGRELVYAYGGRGGPGYGLCECGELSPEVENSCDGRSAWHRKHKLAVNKAEAAKEAKEALR